jgi:uracil-DNA glycosylase family 4
MNNKELQSALEWQLEMGVEEAFGNSILPKKIERTTPKEAKVSEQRTAFNEPASAYQPEPSINHKPPTINEMPKKPVMKVVADNTNSEFLNFSNNEWAKKAKELADKANTLEELKKAVEGFDGLAIKKTATNTVFGEGNPKSKVMFIGEAPGENEDLEGRPFCGLSGQLLDKMLKQIQLERSKNFYITNTLFWRPPGNRKPTPEELAICKPFVEKHIALINPKFIVLVGGTATAGVLNSKDSVSVLRKVISPYNNPYLNKEIPCFTIYHPSFLLRSPSQKKVAWADLIKIKKHLESV